MDSNNYFDKAICRPIIFQNIASHAEKTKSSRIEVKQTASLPTNKRQEKINQKRNVYLHFSGHP